MRSPPERERPAKAPAQHKSLYDWRDVVIQRVSEDEDEDEDEEGVADIPHAEKEERGETDGRTRSKLKTDWKTNPRAKPNRRKDEENTINSLYAYKCTPPVRSVREGD